MHPPHHNTKPESYTAFIIHFQKDLSLWYHLIRPHTSSFLSPPFGPTTTSLPRESSLQSPPRNKLFFFLPSVPLLPSLQDDIEAVTKKWGLEAGLWKVFRSKPDESQGSASKMDSAKKLLKVRVGGSGSVAEGGLGERQTVLFDTRRTPTRTPEG